MANVLRRRICALISTALNERVYEPRTRHVLRALDGRVRRGHTFLVDVLATQGDAFVLAEECEPN